MCNIKKFYWKRYNDFLSCRVKRLFRKQRFPATLTDLKPLRAIEWKKKSNHEWGSAPSYTNSVFHPDNIHWTNDGKVTVYTRRENAIGYDWNGIMQTRPYSSGMIMGQGVEVVPGRFFEVVVDHMKLSPGYWPCFLWLFRMDKGADNLCRSKRVSWPFSGLVYKDPRVHLLKDVRVEDFHVPYFEVDAGEMFVHEGDDINRVTMSTHWGYSDDRKMFNSSGYFDFNDVPLATTCIMVIFTGKYVEVYYNNVLMYRCPLGCPRPEGEIVVPIISDAVLKDKELPFATIQNFFRIVSYQTGVLE